MAKYVRPTDHLSDLSLRFDVVIFSMTPFKDRADLREQVMKSRFGDLETPEEFDAADDELTRVFPALTNDQNFSKMKRNIASYLTDENVLWLSEGLAIDEKDLLDPDIRYLINALAQTAENFGWIVADPNAVLSRVSEKYLVDPSIDPRPGFSKTLFGTYEPIVFEMTNHSVTRIKDISVLPKHLNILKEELSKLSIFGEIPKDSIQIRRLQVAASSDVFKVRSSVGTFFMKIIKRLHRDELDWVQMFEEHFADAELHGEILFQDAACLRPIRVGAAGGTYAEINPQSSELLGLPDKTHFLSLQRYAADRVMFGRDTIPEKDFQNGGAEDYLTSLASNLAKLHLSAKDFNSAMPLKIAAKSLGFMESEATSHIAAFDKIFGTDHEFTKVWVNRENHKMINKAAIEYDYWHKNRPAERQYVMYDLHPFNAFFNTKARECTLIFDFEGMSNDWTEEVVLAFTTHRFIREYVRSAGFPHDINLSDKIRSLASRMADAYTESGGTLPDDYMERLGALVRVSNIGKFIRLVHQLIRGNDVINRRAAVHDAEARKFLLYLRESDFFGPQ